MFTMTSISFKKGDLCNQKFYRNNTFGNTSFSLHINNVTILFNDIEALDEFAEKIEQEITDYQLSNQHKISNNYQEFDYSIQGGTSHFE